MKSSESMKSDLSVPCNLIGFVIKSNVALLSLLIVHTFCKGNALDYSYQCNKILLSYFIYDENLGNQININ